MLFLASAHVGRQAIHRSDQVFDGGQRSGPRPPRLPLEPIAHDVGPGDATVARFGIELVDQRRGQTHRERPHAADRKTDQTCMQDACESADGVA